MLNVSIIIPAWNEEERIADCLMNATRQTVAPHEVIVVNNRSTDRTCDIVEQFQRDHPEAPVILLQQNEDQGLIPTRNFGLNAATGDVLGRIDADCMLKPDWVEVVSGIFTEDPDAMGATGPVVYYDMPAKGAGLAGDDHIRRHTYRADNDQVLLFGSNMAIRASAWHAISGEVCRDPEDVMHEDIDVSLHLLNHGFKTVYSQCMICGGSRTHSPHIPTIGASTTPSGACMRSTRGCTCCTRFISSIWPRRTSTRPKRSGSTSRSSSSRAISTIPSRWTPSNDVE